MTWFLKMISGVPPSVCADLTGKTCMSRKPAPQRSLFPSEVSRHLAVRPGLDSESEAFQSPSKCMSSSEYGEYLADGRTLRRS